jgi:hypothetical protein
VTQEAHGFSLTGNVGRPVYFDGTDWLAASSAGAPTIHTAVISRVPDADTLVLQNSGHLTGIDYAVLTKGEFYFLTDAGGLSTTPGTVSAVALQATETDEAVILSWQAGDDITWGTAGAALAAAETAADARNEIDAQADTGTHSEGTATRTIIELISDRPPSLQDFGTIVPGYSRSSAERLANWAVMKAALAAVGSSTRQRMLYLPNFVIEYELNEDPAILRDGVGLYATPPYGEGPTGAYSPGGLNILFGSADAAFQGHNHGLGAGNYLKHGGFFGVNFTVQNSASTIDLILHTENAVSWALRESTFFNNGSAGGCVKIARNGDYSWKVPVSECSFKCAATGTGHPLWYEATDENLSNVSSSQGAGSVIYGGNNVKVIGGIYQLNQSGYALSCKRLAGSVMSLTLLGVEFDKYYRGLQLDFDYDADVDNEEAFFQAISPRFRPTASAPYGNLDIEITNITGGDLKGIALLGVQHNSSGVTKINYTGTKPVQMIYEVLQDADFPTTIPVAEADKDAIEFHGPQGHNFPAPVEFRSNIVAPVWPKHATGTWISNAVATGALGTYTAALNVLRATPLWIQRPTTLDKIRAEVTTASAGNTFRIGLYADDDGYPGALIANSDVEAFATDSTGVIEKTFSSALTLPQGLYWIAYNNSGGGIALRAWNSVAFLPILGLDSGMGGASVYVKWEVASTYGAMPSTFPGSGSRATGNFPQILFQVA